MAIDLTDIAAGGGGFVIHGEAANDRSGFSVASAGDVNGDGFADIVIGATRAAGAGIAGLAAGSSYVVFGKASGWGAAIDLATIAAGTATSPGGFVIRGQDTGDYTGRSVASAGDINGDGFDDLIIGSPYAAAAGNAKFEAGESHVVFGKAGGWAAAINLADIAAGTGGFVVLGEDEGDKSGYSVASAGDVNGDGFNDFIIGAKDADGAANGRSLAGAGYVVFGKAGGWAAAIDLADIAAGTGGFVIHGQDVLDRAGVSVASAGDLNGDGFADLFIGATGADAAGNAKSVAGGGYVVFGKAGGFGAAIDLGTIGAGTGGFVIHGEDAFDFTGRTVASAGDVNGDGFVDLIIGSSNADAAANAKSDAGDSYVVFGKAGGFGAAIDLTTIAAGNGGFVIHGEEAADQSGYSVASAGDVNGDGFDDLIIGARYADGPANARSFAGAGYVVFGKAGGFDAAINLATIAAGTGGFVIHGQDGGDRAGRSVASAGDMDGDGFDDLIIGAYRGDAAANARNDAGDTYIVFGRDFTGTVTDAGTAAAETLTGSAGADVIVAGQGDDTILGLGGLDALAGGAGHDRIMVSDLAFRRVDGGTGTDTLVLAGTGLTLNLAALTDSRLQGIEAIELGNNALRLTALEVLNLSDTSNTLRVTGSLGLSVTRDDTGWVTGATAGGFTTYTNGQATLLVQVVAPNTAPSVTSGATASFAENGTGIAYQATGTDPQGTALTWSLGGVDAGRFTIDAANGAVTFKAAPNFEAPVDAGANNVYNINVIASDGALTGSKAVAITVSDVVAPSITSASIVSFAENGTGIAYQASATGAGIAWSLTGADAARFTIDAATGAMRFSATPDFEAPGDTGGNNIYNIVVAAVAGGERTALSVAVRVTNLLDGTSGADFLIGTSRNETIDGEDGADTLVGGSGNDVLIGGIGNDRLDGGLGADTLNGGVGDETYVVNNAADVIVEGENEGLDLVLASLSWTLGETLDRLQLTGTANLSGTGNALDNRITGNDGNNRLDGRAGNDTLLGGAGNDILIGGAGADLLSGGTGADRFRFASAAEAGDRIEGFVGADDVVEVSAAGFFGAGVASGANLTALGRYTSNLSGNATGGLAQFVWESDANRLWFDADGNGAGSRVLVLTATAALGWTAADLVVIA